MTAIAILVWLPSSRSAKPVNGIQDATGNHRTTIRSIARAWVMFTILQISFG